MALALLPGCWEEQPRARDLHYFFTGLERNECPSKWPAVCSSGRPRGLHINKYLEGRALDHSIQLCQRQLDTGKPGLFHSSLAAQYGGEAWRGLGENVGYSSVVGNDIDAAALRVWSGLMNSKGHRENILAYKWHDTGVGAILCSDDKRGTKTLYYTQAFRQR
ncbi:MAG: hypothetical protein KC416_16035 [Myxococcales bacterium]|nr:hypothetical protein [Myxococcales bacterium]